MLITNLLPLLTRYSLGCDLVAGADGTVTLTIIPRKAEGAKAALDPGEARPISITASAEEIDAELSRGTDGALGQLFASRKELGDQLAEHRVAEEAAKAAATAKAKPAAKTTTTPAPSPAPAPGEPASLY